MPRNPAAPRRRTQSKPADAPSASGQRLMPPEDGVTVRMYRTGHGDCFLLAFAGEVPEKPVYLLIDCGYKPGSPKHINTKIDDITESIRAATGGHLDVAVITHEHQDHVNGITAARFEKITIGETWLAWTEDPRDRVANRLRTAYKDKLLGLLAARNRLAAAGDTDQARRIDMFLRFELGGEDEEDDSLAPQFAAAGDPSQSMNKQSMKVFKDRAQNGVRYIRPHTNIFSIPGAKDLRVFALGPPRVEDDLTDLDPRGGEVFHVESPGNFFAAAVSADDDGKRLFDNRYCITIKDALARKNRDAFFKTRYGRDDITPGFTPGAAARGEAEAPDNPDWRRIDKDWLYSAEQLALDLNDYTNNSSLVLAFELGKGGKVLLFAADAQRGNWLSWAKRDWTDGDTKVTAKDLLSRTVLYKVGHHGSHNATLNGRADDDYPNLEWMGHEDYGREFTAMITAVRAWAETQKGWDHPLKEIKDALIAKASGRVFQTDTNLDLMTIPDGVSAADWNQFKARVRVNQLYFDYTITR